MTPFDENPDHFRKDIHQEIKILFAHLHSELSLF